MPSREIRLTAAAALLAAGEVAAQSRGGLLDRLQRPAPIATIPGSTFTQSEPREPVTLELGDCRKLGSALHSSWFTHRHIDGELQVTGPMPDINDNLAPDVVMIHDRHRVAERTEEIAGSSEWSPSKKVLHRAQVVDDYFRAKILPAGSFAAAQAVDERRAAIRAKRSDPARLAAQRARTARAKQRRAWLDGQDVEAQ